MTKAPSPTSFPLITVFVDIELHTWILPAIFTHSRFLFHSLFTQLYDIPLRLITNMAEQRKAVIKNADMSEPMQQDAVDVASIALSKYNIEKVSP